MAENDGRPDDTGTGAAPTGASRGGQGFVRHLGVRSGVAINMTQMCAIGPAAWSGACHSRPAPR